MRLEIEDLCVRFGDTPICEAISLALPDGELGCLLGPSGSGKTSLLRAIAGFVTPTRGRIRIGDREVVGAGTALPPQARGVGMVFQDLALLPHRTVRDNIGFGLWRMAAEARRRRVEEMLSLAALTRLAERYPHELSGGQQQRVAVARALAPAPRLLLMDEPFSGLDTELRLAMAQQLRNLVVGSGTTALMVTHDQREALAIADHIGVLHRGRLEQWDTPRAIHDAPATRFVAGFVGDGVLLPATRESDGRIRTELGDLAPVGGGSPGAVEVLVRPSSVVLADSAEQQAVVEQALYRGGDTLFRLRLASGHYLVTAGTHDAIRVGSQVGVRLQIERPVVFDLQV